MITYKIIKGWDKNQKGIEFFGTYIQYAANAKMTINFSLQNLLVLR